MTAKERKAITKFINRMLSSSDEAGRKRMYDLLDFDDDDIATLENSSTVLKNKSGSDKPLSKKEREQLHKENMKNYEDYKKLYAPSKGTQLKENVIVPAIGDLAKLGGNIYSTTQGGLAGLLSYIANNDKQPVSGSNARTRMGGLSALLLSKGAIGKDIGDTVANRVYSANDAYKADRLLTEEKASLAAGTGSSYGTQMLANNALKTSTPSQGTMYKYPKKDNSNK